MERVRTLTGRAIELVVADLRDEAAMDALFSNASFDAVIHFAGLKAVGESTAKPLLYYDNNVGGTLVLLDAMKKHGVFTLVFNVVRPRCMETLMGFLSRKMRLEERRIPMAGPNL